MKITDWFVCNIFHKPVILIFYLKYITILLQLETAIASDLYENFVKCT